MIFKNTMFSMKIKHLFEKKSKANVMHLRFFFLRGFYLTTNTRVRFNKIVQVLISSKITFNIDGKFDFDLTLISPYY